MNPDQIRIYDHSSCLNATTSKIINSKIILRGNSKLILGEFATIENCDITINNSIIHIGSDSKLSDLNIVCTVESEVLVESKVQILNYDLHLESANLIIKNDCILNQGRNAIRPEIYIVDGTLDILEKNVIKADFSIRFGGICKIGSYNCINERTEIRCDEFISIGNFNMISYACCIWDTNTHCQYDKVKRRKITINDFPVIGAEYEKPITKPIVINDDNWIGQRVVVLKGTKINNETVIGTNAVVSNVSIPDFSIAVGNPVMIKSKGIHK